jgi:transposase
MFCLVAMKSSAHIPIVYLLQRRVWRYQRGNQNPYIEEEQTTQWPKEKGQKDKQRSTKHTYKTKDRVTRIPLQTGGELRCSGRVEQIRGFPTFWQFRGSLNSFLFSFVTFKTNSSIHSQQNVILTESRILIGKQTSPIIQHGLNSHIVHGNAFSNLSVPITYHASITI